MVTSSFPTCLWCNTDFKSWIDIKRLQWGKRCPSHLHWSKAHQVRHVFHLLLHMIYWHVPARIYQREGREQSAFAVAYRVATWFSNFSSVNAEHLKHILYEVASVYIATYCNLSDSISKHCWRSKNVVLFRAINRVTGWTHTNIMQCISDICIVRNVIFTLCFLIKSGSVLFLFLLVFFTNTSKRRAWA